MSAELRVPRSDAPQAAPGRSAAGRPLGVALWCAAQGWPVLPLAPGRKTPAANCARCRTHPHTPAECPCLPRGRWCHGFHAATTDQQRIRQWWADQPEFGVGVACGPARLVVIDVDAHPTRPPGRDRVLPGIPIADHVDLSGLSSGFHTLAVLAALRGVPSPTEDASTLRVRTPSGGMHIWYRTAATAARWLCSTGSGSGGRALAWQVDVRAHGGYIVAPGTVTKDGPYTPVGEARTPAELPAWLAQELERTGHRQETGTVPGPRPVPPRAQQAVLAAGGGRDRDRVAKTLEGVLAPVQACAQAPEGTGFSDSLNRAAFTLGGLVAAGRIPRDEAERALKDTAAAVRPGQERRAAQIIRSGFAAGLRHPLHSRGGRP